MTEIIAFPDAEALAVGYLEDSIPELAVSTKVPNPRPTRLVRVTRIGGTKARLNADSANLIFECWDSDSVQAYDLCRLVRAYINALPGNTVQGSWVYRVTEIGGPAYFPDPDTDAPRYQFSVSIDLKGEGI